MIITERVNDARDSIMDKYNEKIVLIEKRDSILETDRKELLKKVDSLENVKSQVIISYDKKIKSIYDATAIEHACWLDSTIQKLSSTENK